MDGGLRFVPSRVEGVPDVTEAAIFPDRIELCSSGNWLSFPFSEMAQWPRPAWFWRGLARIGWRKRFLIVGERDWFHPPTERFFRFFSSPKVVIFMPEEPAESNYLETWFWRVQEVMFQGGFNTWDLG